MRTFVCKILSMAAGKNQVGLQIASHTALKVAVGALVFVWPYCAAKGERGSDGAQPALPTLEYIGIHSAAAHLSDVLAAAGVD
jgi:hypothetical protein